MQKEERKYLVCVRCWTYNQQDYIAQTLDGIVMQKTTYPVVSTIVDDASTDETQNVILKYLEDNYDLNDSKVAYKKDTDYAKIYFAQHKKNRNSFFAVLFLKQNLYSQKKIYLKQEYIREWKESSKYICTCEGDDYWTDPNRLQKMTDFLENHPDYVLVNHRIKRYYQATGELRDDKVNDAVFGKQTGITFGRFFNRFVLWTTQTLATLYRRDVLEKSITDYTYPKGDGLLSYFPLKFGKGYCFNEYMANYRINEGGTFSPLTTAEKSYRNWKMFKDFDRYEKSFFSKLSYIESYSRLLRITNWKGYKDASFNIGILLFTIVYYPIKKSVSLYFKVKYALQS